MITNIKKLIKNHKGAISIEFAGVVMAFTSIFYIAYDFYNTITLQNDLERTNYTVASLFRERTALYPLIEDTISDTQWMLNPPRTHYTAGHFKSYEIFTIDQVKEAHELAKKLLNKDVSIRIDGLFIRQEVIKRAPTRLDRKMISFSSCSYSACKPDIENYLNNRSDMTDTSIANKDYTKLSPFTDREANRTEGFGRILRGRYIPIYRVSMCINNDESLFLKFTNRENNNNRFLPNLCSETVVISRCNDLTYYTRGCPLYYRGPQ